MNWSISSGESPRIFTESENLFPGVDVDKPVPGPCDLIWFADWDLLVDFSFWRLTKESLKIRLRRKTSMLIYASAFLRRFLSYSNFFYSVIKSFFATWVLLLAFNSSNSDDALSNFDFRDLRETSFLSMSALSFFVNSLVLSSYSVFSPSCSPFY